MDAEILRPGPGWKHLGGPVYEHQSGWRIHAMGICGFPVDPLFDGRRWPESRELERMIRINGGNRKRGVMAWALNVLRERFPTSAAHARESE